VRAGIAGLEIVEWRAVLTRDWLINSGVGCGVCRSRRSWADIFWCLFVLRWERLIFGLDCVSNLSSEGRRYRSKDKFTLCTFKEAVVASLSGCVEGEFGSIQQSPP